MSASTASALAVAQVQHEQQLLAVRVEQEQLMKQARQDLEQLTQQLKEQVGGTAGVKQGVMEAFGLWGSAGRGSKVPSITSARVCVLLPASLGWCHHKRATGRFITSM